MELPFFCGNGSTMPNIPTIHAHRTELHEGQEGVAHDQPPYSSPQNDSSQQSSRIYTISNYDPWADVHVSSQCENSPLPAHTYESDFQENFVVAPATGSWTNNQSPAQFLHQGLITPIESSTILEEQQYTPFDDRTYLQEYRTHSTPCPPENFFPPNQSYSHHHASNIGPHPRHLDLTNSNFAERSTSSGPVRAMSTAGEQSLYYFPDSATTACSTLRTGETCQGSSSILSACTEFSDVPLATQLQSPKSTTSQVFEKTSQVSSPTGLTKNNEIYKCAIELAHLDLDDKKGFAHFKKELFKANRATLTCTCGRKISTKKNSVLTNFKRHVLDIHFPSIFPCTYEGCNVVCKRQDNLDNHCRKVHGSGPHKQSRSKRATGKLARGARIFRKKDS